MNFVWEYAECTAFFVHGTLPQTWMGLVTATLGDVALTFIAYLGVTLFKRDLRWPLGAWPPSVWALQFAAAIVLSVAVELHGVASGRWSYKAAAPRIPATSIGVVPVLQLLLLFPAAFGASRIVMNRFSPGLDHRAQEPSRR